MMTSSGASSNRHVTLNDAKERKGLNLARALVRAARRKDHVQPARLARMGCNQGENGFVWSALACCLTAWGVRRMPCRSNSVLTMYSASSMAIFRRRGRMRLAAARSAEACLSRSNDGSGLLPTDSVSPLPRCPDMPRSAQTLIGASEVGYRLGMGPDERRRLRADYGEAWARRVREGNTDPELLKAALREADLAAEYVDNEVGWNVAVGFWNDGVPPNKLTGAAFRALREPLKQLVHTFGEIRRHLK
jgi:hypothetical protein